MRECCLYNLEQAAVILLDEGGVCYFNNTGGSAAIQSRAAGFLVPVSNDPPQDQPELALARRLSAVIKNKIGITHADAAAINDLLREMSSSDFYCVDETRLEQSLESWVFIKIRPQGEYSQFQGFDEFTAILTWPSS